MHYSPLKKHAPLYFNRNQQINACLSAFLGCRETSSDRSRLEIPFKLSDGLPNAVLVTLPAQFPADPPALAIAAHIQHPWVDPASNLRVPCLDLWGSSSDVRLDTVLLDFIQSLSRFQVFTTSPQRRSPDKSSPQGQSNPRGTPNPMRLPFFGKESNNNDRNDNNNLDMHHLGTPQSSLELNGEGGGMALHSASQSQPPSIPPPSAFPQLAAMSTEDLEKAVLDRAYFDKLLAKVAGEIQRSSTSGSVPIGGGEMLAKASALRASNTQLARSNLAKESEMEEIRRQIAIVRSTEFDAAKQSFQEKSKRQETAREVLAPENLMAGVNAAATAAHQSSLDIERQFKNGQLHAEDFVEQYTAARVQHHTLDLKYKAAVVTIPTNRPVRQ